MQVDVKAVGRLHHQGRLYAALPNRSLWGILRYCALHQFAYLAEFARYGLVLLRVVVSRNPPSGVVACHGKLCVFLLNGEVGQVLLSRKFVSEAEPIVEHAEAYLYLTFVLGLWEGDAEFVVVIANVAFFAPNGLPRLVEGRGRMVGLHEACHEVCLLC